MNNKDVALSFMEFMQAKNDSPYYQRLQSALNSLDSYYPQQVNVETIGKGMESCKSLAHAMISANSSYSETRKEIEKAAYTAYYETLKYGYKDLFRRRGLLVE